MGLTLQRKLGEKTILILPDKRVVTLEVTKQKGENSYKLYVEAPQDVKILRGELYIEGQ